MMPKSANSMLRDFQRLREQRKRDREPEHMAEKPDAPAAKQPKLAKGSSFAGNDGDRDQPNLFPVEDQGQLKEVQLSH